MNTANTANHCHGSNRNTACQATSLETWQLAVSATRSQEQSPSETGFRPAVRIPPPATRPAPHGAPGVGLGVARCASDQPLSTPSHGLVTLS